MGLEGAIKNFWGSKAILFMEIDQKLSKSTRKSILPKYFLSSRSTNKLLRNPELP